MVVTWGGAVHYLRRGAFHGVINGPELPQRG